MKFFLMYFLFISSFSMKIMGKRKAQGKVTYEFNWAGGFKLCDNIQHSVIDITELKIIRDTPTSTSLEGYFEYKQPIMVGTGLDLFVEKETPQGKVLTYTYDVLDLCDHVSQEGMPWSPILDRMDLETKKCPLPAKKYNMHELNLNISAANTLLTHENVGEYEVTVEFKHKGEGLDVVEHLLTCYKFGIAIEEVRQKAE